jgi:hypothetical protein
LNHDECADVADDHWEDHHMPEEPTPALPELFKVEDLVKWGNLVKMWATREAYPDVPVMPVPATLTELKKQVDAIELKITIPSHLKGLSIAIHSPEVLYIRLPPASMIKAVETHLYDDRTDYPVPAIYNMYNPVAFQVPKNEKLAFHAARIGDYSIAQCG